MEVKSTVIEETIVDSIVGYNDTVVRGKNSAKLQKITHDEKVGLFYNTLRRSFQYRLSGLRFDRFLKPIHLSCTFRENGELKTFQITKEFHYRDEWYLSDSTSCIDVFWTIKDICKRKFSGELSSTHAMIKLDQIINSIKT